MATRAREFLVTRTDPKTGEEYRRLEPYLFGFTVYLDNRALKLVAHTDEFNHLIVSDPLSGFKFSSVSFYARGSAKDRDAARESAEQRIAQLTATGKARFAWSIIERARERAAALPTKE